MELPQHRNLLLVNIRNGGRSYVPECEACTPSCDDSCPCDGYMEYSHTGRYDDAIAEREAYAEHVRASCERRSGYEELHGRPVGLDSRRRECHAVSPWTDPQRRVRLVWGRGDVRDDGGAACYYAWRDGKPYPFREKRTRHAAVVAPDRLDIHHRRDLLDSATVHAVTSGGKHILTAQDARDYKDAAPGSGWLREYGADAEWAIGRAVAAAGISLDVARATLGAKGRPTNTSTRVRRDVFRALLPLCPEVVTFEAAAAVFGMRGEHFAKAFAIAKSRLASTPTQGSCG